MTLEDFKNEILPLKQRLYRYALSLVYREELAKDIVQEVFLKVWEKRDQMHTIRNREAWCIRCTRNLAIDKLKAHNNRTEELDKIISRQGSQSHPDTMVETEDLLESTKMLLQGLPEKQREIFRMKELMGYSNQEIEKFLGLDAIQVKVNLFRARKKIRSSLNKLMNYGLQKN